VSGTVTAADAATVTATGGDATVSGTVTAADAATVTATGGDATVSGTVTATADNGIAKVVSTDQAVGITGNVSSTGENGVVDVDANTSVTINGGATVSAGKDVFVDAANSDVTVASSTMNAGNNMHVATTTDGDVVIDTGVTMTAGQNLTIDSAKGVEIKSDVTATGKDAYIQANDGDLTMAAGTTVTAGNNAYLGSEKAGDGTSKLTISKVEATDAAWLKTDGDIVNGYTGNVNVKANQLRLEAGKAIGSSSEAVNIDANKLEAVASNGGSYINEANSVTIGTVGDANGKLKVVKVETTGDETEVESNDIIGDSASGDLEFTAGGDIEVAEDMKAGGNATIASTGGELAINKGVTVEAGGTLTVDANGDLVIDGTLSGSDVIATGGAVAFGSEGQISGGNIVLTSGSDITQEDATVPVSLGYATKTDVHAAVAADNDAKIVAGGSVGKATSGTSEYLGVSAETVSVEAGGDVALAGANHTDIKLGEGGIVAGKNVALYTSGTVRPNGKTVKGNNIAVTAANYMGGIVGINDRALLTVNNLSRAATLLSIFQTRGGNPKPYVSTLPNHTVVFVDGRLAGGDLQTINKLGSLEAFPVQTPELKSEQGVFGNPMFLHDELDVATPLAVGAIDFLLLDIPRLTLSSDFPIAVEKQVAAMGLNPRTSYWFGQNSDDDSEKEIEGEKGSETPSDGKKDGEKSAGDNQTAMN
jgi:hypothetical protein